MNNPFNIVTRIDGKPIYRGQATSNQELLEEQILSIIDNAHNMTRSDLQGVVSALAKQYELMKSK